MGEITVRIVVIVGHSLPSCSTSFEVLIVPDLDCSKKPCRSYISCGQFLSPRGLLFHSFNTETQAQRRFTWCVSLMSDVVSLTF